MSWWRKKPITPKVEIPVEALEDPEPKIDVLRSQVKSEVAQAQIYREMVEKVVRGIQNREFPNGA